MTCGTPATSASRNGHAPGRRRSGTAVTRASGLSTSSRPCDRSPRRRHRSSPRRVFPPGFAMPYGSRNRSAGDRCISSCPRILRPMKPLRTSFPRHVVELPVASVAAIERAEASRPLVMLGAAEQLSVFVRRCRIPFFNTQMGKGAVNAGSNLNMGTAALSERDWFTRLPAHFQVVCVWSPDVSLRTAAGIQSEIRIGIH
jgi:hypothetical protein